MDQIVIGNFLTKKRKEKNMTQARQQRACI